MTVATRTCRACGAPVEPTAVSCAKCGGANGPWEPVTSHTHPLTSAQPPVFEPRGPAPLSRDVNAAPCARRALSWLIELAAGGLLAVVVSLAFGQTLADVLHPNGSAGPVSGLTVPYGVVLVWAVVGWVWEARTGDRLGNRAVGIRTVILGTSRAPGLGKVLVSRVVLMVAGIGVAAVVLAGSMLLGDGGAWVVLAVLAGSVASVVAAGSGAFDRSAERQGWHERASGTVMIRRPPARQERSGGADRSQGEPPTWRQETDRVPVATPSVPTAHVDFPRVASTSSDLIAQVPGFEPADATDSRSDPPALRLVFDTGELVEVSGAGLVGRAPEPGPAEHADHVVAIDDPDLSVSKTHLAFGPQDTGIWVEDLGSTNGTQVEVGGTPPRTLVPGDRVPVPHGGTVHFGARSFVVGKVQ